MHCKDMDNAMLAIRDKGEGDASSIASPMLELAQNLMHQVILLPLPHPTPYLTTSFSYSCISPRSGP